MVYANPKLTTLSIPENSPSDTVFESYANGRQVASHSNSDIVSLSERMYSTHFSQAGNSPVFMCLDLETPLALASFLGNNANMHKVFIPGTFNMNKIMEDIKH